MAPFMGPGEGMRGVPLSLGAVGGLNGQLGHKVMPRKEIHCIIF